jgi:uncharacterized protein YndB with AHSA1/START domain
MTTTVSVTRTLNAPRDVVWRVHTEPQYSERWFGAVPGSAEVDVRTGGSWKADVATGPGESFTLAGSHVEVVVPERLVLTIPGGVEEAESVTVFTDRGDVTEVTTSCQAEPERRSATEATIGTILDSIAEIIASL